MINLKKQGRNDQEKADALKEMRQSNSFLDSVGTDIHPVRVDIDKKVWKNVNNLKNATTREDHKSVSGRALFTEAILDLFQKYIDGNGKYEFKSDEDKKEFEESIAKLLD